MVPCGFCGSEDPSDTCVMCSTDPQKDAVEFRDQFDAHLRDSRAASGNGYFGRFTFPIGWRFRGTRVGRDADFIEARFLGDACFSDADFKGAARFTRSEFYGTANFTEATFREAGVFAGARFRGDAVFQRAVFSDRAVLDGASFLGGADFKEATFKSTASFANAEFQRTADFAQGRFTGEVNFGGARFGDTATFSDATFGVVRLAAAQFRGQAQFNLATFQDGALFVGVLFCETADFSFARFDRPEETMFLRVRGKSPTRGMRARFTGCKIDKVAFVDVDWFRLGGRLVLMDELDVAETGESALSSYEVVATAYRQLVQNFEGTRCYELAEQADVGAMEMRRKDPRNFVLGARFGGPYARNRLLRSAGEQLSVTNLYRLSSRYGTQYLQALAVLVVMVIGFGFLFALPWLPLATDSPMPAHPPNLRVLRRGFKHSIEIATFSGSPRYRAGGVPGYVAEVTEKILVPAQTAMLLFALNRRFRR